MAAGEQNCVHRRNFFGLNYRRKIPLLVRMYVISLFDTYKYPQ